MPYREVPVSCASFELPSHSGIAAVSRSEPMAASGIRCIDWERLEMGRRPA